MGASFLTLGRFVPRSSAIHALDAAAKLVCAILLAAAAVWGRSLTAQGCVAAVLLLCFGAARLPATLLLRALRGAAWLLAFLAVANLGWAELSRLVGAGSEGAVTGGAELALLLSRILNLILVGVVFTATTVPVDLAEALERLLRPLGRVRLPVHELGVLLVLSLSFIPIFFDEARGLAAAHRIKTGRARWSWAHRARAAVPLLVPLFLSVVRRGDELAVAMDARCFVPGRPRTSLVPARTGRREIGCLALGVSVLFASVWLL
jgi:energy-coupling factor transport system permease protein